MVWSCYLYNYQFLAQRELESLQTCQGELDQLLAARLSSDPLELEGFWPESSEAMAVVFVETRLDDGTRVVQSPMKFKASASRLVLNWVVWIVCPMRAYIFWAWDLCE